MISDRTLRQIIRSDSFIALTGDLIRAALAVALPAITLLWLVYYGALGRVMSRELHMNDFGKFYYSAQFFLQGRNMYSPSPATAMPVLTETRQFLNMNPPHFHFLILPLALLTPATALLCWTLANLLSLVMSVRLIARELSLRWTRSGVIWTVFAIVICSATGIIVLTGQITFILLLPVTMAWIAARRGQWTRAAVYLGVMASIKPFLAIFWLYFVARRQWRAAAAMSAAAAGCVLVGLAVFGWQNYEAWLGALSAVDWVWSTMNGSIMGGLARTFAQTPLFVPAVLLPAVVAPVAATLGCVLGVWSIAAIASDRSREATDRAFAGLLLTAQLVSPLGWAYYLPLLAGPATGLWLSSAGRPSAVRNALALAAVPGLIFPLALTVAWREHVWGGPTLGSIYGWTTLALWASVLLDPRTASAAERS